VSRIPQHRARAAASRWSARARARVDPDLSPGQLAGPRLRHQGAAGWGRSRTTPAPPGAARTVERGDRSACARCAAATARRAAGGPPGRARWAASCCRLFPLVEQCSTRAWRWWRHRARGGSPRRLPGGRRCACCHLSLPFAAPPTRREARRAGIREARWSSAVPAWHGVEAARRRCVTAPARDTADAVAGRRRAVEAGLLPGPGRPGGPDRYLPPAGSRSRLRDSWRSPTSLALGFPTRRDVRGSCAPRRRAPAA
jgi:hypothetical protein